MYPARRTVIAVAVALLAVSAGCLGGGPSEAPDTVTDAESPPTTTAVPTDTTGAAGSSTTTSPPPTTATATGTDGVQSAAVTNANDTRAYAFDVSMTVEISNVTTVMNTTGVIDREAERLRQNVTVTTDGRRFNATTYVVGDTAYLRFLGVWRRTDVDSLPGDVGAVVWNDTGALAQQRAFLNGSRVAFRGIRTVDGQRAYVVVVEPNPHRVKAVLLERVARGSGLGEDLLADVTVENVSYRQYVAVDSLRLVGADVDVEYALRGQPVHQSVRMRFSAYDQPVNVTVPEAARRDR